MNQLVPEQKPEIFSSSSRRSRTLCGGRRKFQPQEYIVVFRGLKFESDAAIGKIAVFVQAITIYATLGSTLTLPCPLTRFYVGPSTVFAADNDMYPFLP